MRQSRSLRAEVFRRRKEAVVSGYRTQFPEFRETSPQFHAFCIYRHRLAHLHSYTYTVVMKNITLSVDDNVLATVRRHAAERNSTVNALVREYLTNLASHQDRAKRARARLRQLSAQSQGRLGKRTWSREDLHDG